MDKQCHTYPTSPEETRLGWRYYCILYSGENLTGGGGGGGGLIWQVGDLILASNRSHMLASWPCPPLMSELVRKAPSSNGTADCSLSS